MKCSTRQEVKASVQVPAGDVVAYYGSFDDYFVICDARSGEKWWRSEPGPDGSLGPLVLNCNCPDIELADRYETSEDANLRIKAEMANGHDGYVCAVNVKHSVTVRRVG